MGRGETEFEIAGQAFYLERLDPEDSLRGMSMISPIMGVVGSIQAAEEGEFGNITAQLVGAADQLPGLLKLFVPYAKTQLDPNGPKKVSLGTTYKHAFKGRPEVMIAFLANCIQVEYGTFLAGEGLAVVGQAVGSLFKSLTGSAGQSGD